MAYSDFDRIEALNLYFSSISSIDDSNKTLSNMYYNCNDTLCNITINEQEVLDIISVIPVNKTIGPDCISHKMLKSAIFTIIVKPLTSRFNRSLSEKFFFNIFMEISSSLLF